MKRLLLMRHGKSAWSAPGWSMDQGGDHARPLAPRGEKASRLMGRTLAAIGWRPDAIVSSTAERARRTAEHARGAGFDEAPLRLESALYEAPVSVLLDVVRGVDDAVGTVLLVGHEPTFSGAVAAFAGGGNVRMVTAAVAALELGITRWRDARAGCGTLLFLLPPRRIREMLDESRDEHLPEQLD